MKSRVFWIWAPSYCPYSIGMQGIYQLRKKCSIWRERVPARLFFENRDTTNPLFCWFRLLRYITFAPSQGWRKSGKGLVKRGGFFIINFLLLLTLSGKKEGVCFVGFTWFFLLAFFLDTFPKLIVGGGLFFMFCSPLVATFVKTPFSDLWQNLKFLASFYRL